MFVAGTKAGTCVVRVGAAVADALPGPGPASEDGTLFSAVWGTASATAAGLRVGAAVGGAAPGPVAAGKDDMGPDGGTDASADRWNMSAS